MDKAISLVGWTALIVAFGVAAAIGGVMLTHPGDEASYVAAVQRYVPDTKQASPDEIIAAGDRACGWLSRQPLALWRTDDKYHLDTLLTEYGKEMTSSGAELPMAGLASEAWLRRCPGTAALHRPHYVFSNPPGD